MPGSGISAFGDPDEFASALAETGSAEFLVVGRGQFRAHLTRMALPHLRLSSAEESLARIAFVSPPRGMIRVVLPGIRPPHAVYGGRRIGAREIVTHSLGVGVHERLDERCRWREILLPARHLSRYGRALTGGMFLLPPGMRRWRPESRSLRRMIALYDAAMRVTKARPELAVAAEPARGLEQELTEALIECLPENALEPETLASRHHIEIMAELETLRVAHPDGPLSVANVCVALKISGRTLRACCKAHLDLSPSRYLRARRLQLVRHALRRADPSETSVARVARQFGFGELGRFAARYRALFGEFPSVTLKG